MSDMTTEYRGVTLHFVKDTFGDRKGDLWEAWGIRTFAAPCLSVWTKSTGWNLRSGSPVV